MSGEGRCIRVAFCALEANFAELRYGEVQHSPVPIGQEALAKGCPYRRALCFLCTELGVVVLVYIR
jgi:hypothetical protein